MGIERVVTDETVFEVADQLTAKGEKVTNRAIWTAIGGGSMTTISHALRRWKENQVLQVAQPIERTPLPSSLIDVVHHAAAQLWDAALGETKAELEQLAQATNARVSEAQSERDDTLTELQATAEELEQTKLERDAAQTENDHKAAEIARLQTELHTQTQAATDAHHRAETAAAAKAELQARVEQLTRLLADEQTARKQAETDANALRATVAKQSAEQAASDRRAAETEARAAAHQQAAAEEQAARKQAETEANNLKATLAKLSAELEASERRAAETTARAENEITSLKAERHELQTMLKGLVGSIGTAKDPAPVPATPEPVDDTAMQALTTASMNDTNFKTALDTANAATLQAALAAQGLAKTKRTKLEAALQKRIIINS